MINILFSMDGPPITAPEGEPNPFEQFGQWVLLNERESRLLFDGVATPETVAACEAVLTSMGRNPVIIGAWHQDGTPVPEYPLDTAAWREVAPDEVDATDPENPVYSRPTEFREIHRWAGWSPKP